MSMIANDRGHLHKLLSKLVKTHIITLTLICVPQAAQHIICMYIPAVFVAVDEAVQATSGNRL